MFEDEISLRIEHGKALSCYERALFYASRAPEYLNILDQEGFPYCNRGPVAVGNEATSEPAISEQNPLVFITAIYYAAYHMLFDRLDSITEEYFSSYEELLRKEIGVTDRDIGFTKDSRKAVSLSFRLLADEIIERAQLEGPLFTKKSLGLYCQDWVGLYNICHLVMNEITFISGRVDDFHSMLNSQAALEKANESLRKADDSLVLAAQGIRYAYLGIGVGAFFSILSLLWSIFGDKGENSDDSNRLHLEVGKISGILSARENSGPFPAGADQDFQKRETQTARNVEELRREVSDLSKAIGAMDKGIGIAGTKVETLSSDINELQTQTSNLQRSIDENTAHNPEDIRAFGLRLDSIQGSLNELRVALESKKVPQINVTPRIQVDIPKQDPPSQKKAIGLLNIDTSKQGDSK